MNGSPNPDLQPRSGARDGSGKRVPDLCELSPFSIFCALYLGITERDGFSRQDAEAVARRFGISRDELNAFLAEHGLRNEDLRQARFDLESARLDIRVAPEGISRTELARTLFEDLRSTVGH